MFSWGVLNISQLFQKQVLFHILSLYNSISSDDSFWVFLLRKAITGFALTKKCVFKGRTDVQDMLVLVYNFLNIL